MRGLALLGLIALAFGLGSYYATGTLGVFAWLNLAGGSVALAAAAVAELRRTGLGSGPIARRRLLRQALWVALALGAAVGAERATQRSGLQLDWTAERRFELAPAMRQALAALPGELVATLYYETFDPRVRSTRLLLRTLAEHGPMRVHERVLSESSADAERYEVGSSNTVVLELGDRYQTVELPTEGSLYEALRGLTRAEAYTVYLARGEGEGDFARDDPTGYAGLAAALHAEGYRLRDLVLAALDTIPPDAAALLIVGPRRGLREPALDALRAYLAGGGRLVALLDPGVETGLEALLADWGFALPDAIAIDPASGPVEGDPAGLNPIVFHYAEHPVVRGLDASRMLFFRRARPVEAVRRPAPEDRIGGVAFTSERAWLAEDVRAAERGLLPERPPEARETFLPLVAAGAYPRDGRETRIVVFGDSDFASNRYLRALYNLDVVLNAVHWATEREAEISLRPKVLNPDQFPMTPQDSLRMFYGVGLLIPELCLMAAALAWLRRRSA